MYEQLKISANSKQQENILDGSIWPNHVKEKSHGSVPLKQIQQNKDECQEGKAACRLQE
jgi:hypothetical protein